MADARIHPVSPAAVGVRLRAMVMAQQAGGDVIAGIAALHWRTAVGISRGEICVEEG